MLCAIFLLWYVNALVKEAPVCCGVRVKGEEEGINGPFSWLEMWTEGFIVGEAPQQLCHCYSEAPVSRSLLSMEIRFHV